MPDNINPEDFLDLSDPGGRPLYIRKADVMVVSKAADMNATVLICANGLQLAAREEPADVFRMLVAPWQH